MGIVDDKYAKFSSNDLKNASCSARNLVDSQVSSRRGDLAPVSFEDALKSLPSHFPAQKLTNS